MRAGRRRGCGHWFTVALCSAVLTAASAAHAQTSADELAHKHFESGAAYLEQADYDSSLREFQAAYDLSKRPEILINVATVHERIGHLKEAIAALEKYLAEAPTDDRADTIKIRVENLKKRLAAEPEPAPTPPPKAEPAPAPVPTVAPPPPLVTHGPDRSTSAHRDLTLPIILFSAGGAFAIGSVVTGLMASSEHSKDKDSCSPNCTDSQVSKGRTLSVTSTVLTGAAVVAGAIGAVILIGGGKDEEPGKTTAFVGVTPTGVTAGSRWRFW